VGISGHISNRGWQGDGRMESWAKSLWQVIWEHTGKQPQKCLYNVMELMLFRFLSDTKVLGKYCNFDSVREHLESSQTAALTHYVRKCRPEMIDCFGRSIIGEAIVSEQSLFVGPDGPSIVHAPLFAQLIVQLKEVPPNWFSDGDYDKSRLYEMFLRQSAESRLLGQFFTPRVVVRAMLDMSCVKLFKAGQKYKVCDPFCGVGGLLLETLSRSEVAKADYTPKGPTFLPKISLFGMDRGGEDSDDYQTIAMAKFNLAVHLASHVNKESIASLGALAHSMFKLVRTPLGTFGEFPAMRFDLIVSNPPYNYRGSAVVRESLEAGEIDAFYSHHGRGTEALAMDWIAEHLAPGGQAIVVVPDGLLLQTKYLEQLSQRVEVNGVIALPPRTFYATDKKTCILIVSKKVGLEPRVQTSPVFTAVVAEIGESRDLYRLPIDRNDLSRVVQAFNSWYYEGLTPCSAGVKVVPAQRFLEGDWSPQRFWTMDELRQLDVVDDSPTIAASEYPDAVKKLTDVIRTTALSQKPDGKKLEFQDVCLGDDEYFEFIHHKTGWAKTVWWGMRCVRPSDGYPLYSAGKDILAYIDAQRVDTSVIAEKLIRASTSEPVISFAANGDGSAGANLEYHTEPFLVSRDRTCFRVKRPTVLSQYIYFKLHGMKQMYGFGHSLKATPGTVADVTVSIPVGRGAVDYQTKYVVWALGLQNQQELIRKWCQGDVASTIVFD